MIVLPLSPLEAQCITSWARLDRLTSGNPDATLQELACRISAAVHEETMRFGILIDQDVAVGPPQPPVLAPACNGRKAPKQCLAPGCGNRATARGMCCNCYQKSRAEVAKGHTSWLKLEQEGRAIPRMLEAKYCNGES